MPTLTGFAFGGGKAPVDHTIPVPPDSSGNHTILGTLLQTFTTSGTYTPGAGITMIDVVVIGGGGNGGYGNQGTGTNNAYGGGGAGGEVCVYRNVPVSGPVSVTVGGANTPSSFGSLQARSAATAASSLSLPINPGLSWNPLARSHGGAGGAGRDGISINGTFYAGGGGGSANYDSRVIPNNPGGAGGGGPGGNYHVLGGGYFLNGGDATAGTGGGGGGTAGYSPSYIAGLGASGRVMIYGASS